MCLEDRTSKTWDGGVRFLRITILKKRVKNLIAEDLISPLFWEDFANEIINTFANSRAKGISETEINNWIEKMCFDYRSWFDANSARTAIKWAISEIKKLNSKEL